MARRRTRRRRRGVHPLLVLTVAALAARLTVYVVTWVREHTGLAIAIAAAVAAVTVSAGVAWARRRARRGRAVRRVARLGDPTGRGAEHLVAQLLERDGCARVQVCGGGGDLGADVIGVLPDGRRIVVQVKDYAKPIGSPAVQTFNGTCWAEHGADVAVFVTTSRFTDAAAAFAERHGIVCVDGEGLAAWTAGESAVAA